MRFSTKKAWSRGSAHGFKFLLPRFFAARKRHCESSAALHFLFRLLLFVEFLR